MELRLRADQDLELKVHLGDVVSEEVGRSLSLEVNDVPVPLALAAMGGRQMLATGRVPTAVLQRRQPLTRLRFRVAETRNWPEGASESCEPRRVAFCQLMLSPA